MSISILNELFKGIRDNDRVVIGKGLSLIESSTSKDREKARELMKRLLPYSGKSIRLGITGIPGSGKSTFIESFGNYMSKEEKRVAVLTIDPSSLVSKGSILGDKTRMDQLSKNQNVFIRPSPSGTMLGGIARNTRESIILLESAGYDYILVETVGVGQSEVSVAELVDVFMLILISGAGDELQGIKKGIMEKANIVVVNKADGSNLKAANLAKASLENALSILYNNLDSNKPRVFSASSTQGTGIPEITMELENMVIKMKESGKFQEKRVLQNVNWFNSEWKTQIGNYLEKNPGLVNQKGELMKKIKAGELDPFSAADILTGEYLKEFSGNR
jgi:GTPase